MKNLIILLITVVGLATLTESCKSDTKKVEQPKKEQSSSSDNKSKKAEPKSAPSTKKLPAFNKLTKMPGVTQYVVDKIDNVIVKGAKQPIAVKGANVKIRGWAVDKLADNKAGGVYLKIGNEYHKAEYGLNRGGVARMLKNDNYTTCGFELVLPKSKLPKGVSEIEVYVVDSKRSSYYSPNKGRNIKIKN